jgi:hypothetical protein
MLGLSHQVSLQRDGNTVARLDILSAIYPAFWNLFGDIPSTVLQ